MRFRKYRDDRKARLRAIVAVAKRDGCKYCDECAPCCLDFHHVAGKDFTIGAINRRGWAVERLEREIRKCTVVCSNCHRKLHAGLLK